MCVREREKKTERSKESDSKNEKREKRAKAEMSFFSIRRVRARASANVARFVRFLFFSLLSALFQTPRHVLFRRAAIEALAAGRRLVRFEGLRARREKEMKESARERARTAKRAALAFLSAKKREGGLTTFRFLSELSARTKRLGIISKTYQKEIIDERKREVSPRRVETARKKRSKANKNSLLFFSHVFSSSSILVTGSSPTARSSARSKS